MTRVMIDSDDLNWLLDNIDARQVTTPDSQTRLERIVNSAAPAGARLACRCAGRTDVWCTSNDCTNNPGSGDLVPKPMPEPTTVSVIVRDGADGMDCVLAVAATSDAAAEWARIYNLGRISGTASYENHEVWTR